MSADTQLVASGRGARGGYDYDVLLLDLSSMKVSTQLSTESEEYHFLSRTELHAHVRTF